MFKKIQKNITKNEKKIEKCITLAYLYPEKEKLHFKYAVNGNGN